MKERVAEMPKGTEYAKEIIDYLKEIYPQAATLSEILKASKIESCSLSSWMDTLVADREVEIIGKKGRSNLYRLKSG